MSNEDLLQTREIQNRYQMTTSMSSVKKVLTFGGVRFSSVFMLLRVFEVQEVSKQLRAMCEGEC